MAKMEDLTGKRFGRWIVISFSHREGKNSLWKCQCECGTKAVIFRSVLTTGRSKSCGCLRDELASKRAKTHGMTGTQVYVTWKNIHSRCIDPSNRSYKYYGARGIKVCKRWKTFEIFYSDFGHLWSDGMSIERKNNDKDYSPSNCIWIPNKDQSRNRRSNIEIDTPWGRMICADAARKLGISAGSFCRRRKNWPPNRWFE